MIKEKRENNVIKQTSASTTCFHNLKVWLLTSWRVGGFLFGTGISGSGLFAALCSPGCELELQYPEKYSMNESINIENTTMPIIKKTNIPDKDSESSVFLMASEKEDKIFVF